jgi:hypothetical protein
MERLKRYAYTLTAMLFGIVVIFLVHWLNSIESINEGREAAHTTIGIIDWSLVAIFAGWAVLCIWGIIGVLISEFRRGAEDIAKRDVVISRKSWHYRLNKWANFGDDPDCNLSECEYWARMFHGLYIAPVVYTIFFSFLWFIRVVVFNIALVIYWLFSFKPDFSATWNKEVVELDRGNQIYGPLTLVSIMAVGVSLLYWLVFDISFGTPFKIIGIIVAGVLAAAMAIFLLIVVYKIFVRPLAHFVMARLAGACRRTVYTD